MDGAKEAYVRMAVQYPSGASQYAGVSGGDRPVNNLMRPDGLRPDGSLAGSKKLPIDWLGPKEGTGRLLVEARLRGGRTRIQDDYTICIFESMNPKTRDRNPCEIATQLVAGPFSFNRHNDGDRSVK